MNKEIITTDLDYSAWLLLQTVRLTRVTLKNEDGRIVVFAFECQSQEQKWALETLWQGGNTSVAAKPFGKSLSKVKVIVRNIRQQQPQEMNV